MILLAPTFLCEFIFHCPEHIKYNFAFMFIAQFIYIFIIINLFKYLYTAVKNRKRKKNDGHNP